MADRELLELAAKAAGKEGGYLFRAGGSKGSGLPYDIEGFQLVGGAMWNPLRDDGVALRLAVELGLKINQVGMAVCVHWKGGTTNERHNRDPYAATRRAIVRAAAEMAAMRPTDNGAGGQS